MKVFEKTKRALSVLLTLCMLLTCIPVQAFAADVHSAPTPACSCESDDPAEHAPFCAVYERTGAECSCAVKCSAAEPNLYCEHCYFEGIALCSGEDEAAAFAALSGDGWETDPYGYILYVTGRITEFPQLDESFLNEVVVEYSGELALSETVDYPVTNNGGLITGGVYTQMFENGGTITGGSFMDEVNNNGTIDGGEFYGLVSTFGSGSMVCGKFMPGADLGFFSAYPEYVIHSVNGVDTRLPFEANALDALGPGQWYEGDTPVSSSDYIPLTYTQYSASYEVNVLSAVNGTVSVDKTLAMAGETVTVTVSPNTSYVLASLLVGGEDVTSLVADNSYSFTMPAKNVSVQANFSLPFGDGWHISGSPSYFCLNVTGKLTELPVIPGMEYATISVQEGGELALSETVSLSVKNSGTISSGNFTGNVTNRANLTGGSYSALVDNMAGGLITGGEFSGVLCNFSSGVIDGAKLLSGADFSAYGSGSAAFVHSVNGVETVLPYGENLLSHLGSGTWYAGDTPVSDTDTVPFIYTEYAAVYKINTASTSGGSVSADKEYAKAGETVTVTITPEGPYRVDVVYLDAVDITDLVVDNRYGFTMPAKNVLVSASFSLPSGEGWKLIGFASSFILNVTGKLTELPNLGLSLNSIIVDAGGELALSETVDTRITGSGVISGGTYTGPVSISGAITGGTFHGSLTASSNVSDSTITGTFRNQGTVSDSTVSGAVYNHGSIEKTKFLPGASLADGDAPVSVIHSVNGVDIALPYGQNLLAALGEGNWFAGDTPITAADTVPLIYTEFVRAYTVSTLVTPFAEGGSITVEKTLVKFGDTVNFSTEIAGNYWQKSLSVVDAENNTVPNNGTSFVMPASNVTVNLQLVKLLNASNVSVDKTSFVYDGNVHKPQVTVTDGDKLLVENQDYIVRYFTEPCVDAGDYYVNVAFRGDYNGLVSIDYTIRKADPVLDVHAFELVYNGSAQKLVDTDSIAAGKLEFSLDGETWSEQILTATDAGSYEVFVRFPGSGNHNSAQTKLTAVIAPCPVTVTAKANQYKYYDAADPELKYTVTGGAVLNGSLSREAGETVGSYAILQGSVTNANNPNYAITFVGTDFVIQPAGIASVGDPTVGMITYGDDLSASVLSNNWKWIDGTQIPDGSGYFAAYYDDDYVNYDFSGVDGYNEETGRVEREFFVVVEKAHRTITGLSAESAVYDGNPKPGYSGTPAAEGYDGAFEVTYVYPDDSTSTEMPVNAGGYIVYISIPDSDPHYYGRTGVFFVIEKAEPDLSGVKAVEGLVYNGEAQKLIASDEIAAGKLEFSLDGETWSKEISTATDAGSYEVFVRFPGNGNYYSARTKLTAVIAPRPIAITATPITKTYGDADPALTYTVEGLVNGDTLTGALERTAGEAVGSYSILQGSLSAGDNYTVTYTGAALAVQQKPITITADALTKTYGDADPTLTYTVEGLVNGDTLTGALERTAGEAVGSYSIQQGSLSAGDNYAVSYTGAALTVAKRAVTFTAKDQTILHGTAISTAAFTADGLVAGHTAVVTLTPSTANVTANGSIAAGAAVITANGADVTANYQIAYVDGKLVIEPDTSAIDGLTPDNVTSDDAEDIQAVQDALQNADSTTPEWDDLADDCKDLQDKIEEIEEALQQAGDKADDFDPESVNSDDQAALEQLDKEIEDLLDTDNLTDEERAALEETKQQVEEMLDEIEQTATDSKDATDAIEAVDPETVTSADKDELEQAVETLDELLQEDHLTDEERAALEDAKADAEEMLDVIENAQNATQTENTQKVEGVTPENVQPEDKDALEGAKEDLENALEQNGSNYTEEEKQAIQDEIDRMEQAIESLEKAEEVTGTLNQLPETVEPDDEDAADQILDAKADYDALTDHEKSLVDEAAKQKLDELVAALTDYQVVKGSGAQWNKDSGAALSFTANGPFGKFTGVKVDGKLVDAKHYEAVAGSTIVTLKASYLQSLSAGEHTIAVVYTDGEATGTFGVLAVAAVSPVTGDAANLVLWSGAMAVSLAAAALLVETKKKKSAR